MPSSGPIAPEHTVPVSPVLNRRTTLKDAMSLLLGSDVNAGVVVDRNGALLGIVTVAQITDWVRTSGDAVPEDHKDLADLVEDPLAIEQPVAVEG